MAGRASKKFDLGELGKALASTAQHVPDSDTAGREQIEYIDVDLLDSDPGNFYQLSDLDGLADNIATIGLQQPIRVRSGENGHVVIVSGHRRTAAIRKLVKEGRTDLREVPCIRETDDASPALRELRLIYANSSTRDLSAAEIGRQAEKVRELLYQLKEEGYEFPGRMRDHVAEACNISRSKLARLEKIATKLAPCYKPLWESGQLPEDTADALSSLPDEVQERIKRVCPKKVPTARNIRSMGERLESKQCDYCTVDFHCPGGTACNHQDKFFRHDLTCGSWETCRGETCCVECSRGGEHRPDSGSYGGAACPEMCGNARTIYDKAKAKKKDSEEQKAAKARSKAVTQAMADAGRIVRAADAAGLGDDAKLEATYSDLSKLKTLRQIAQGDVPEGMNNYTLSEIIPYRTETLLKMAQGLHCSTDYLLGLTDQLHPAAAEAGQMVLASWMPGALTPPEPCEVVADVDAGEGVKMRRLLYWDGTVFRFKKSGVDIEVSVTRWLRLPEVEKEENDA